MTGLRKLKNKFKKYLTENQIICQYSIDKKNNFNFFAFLISILFISAASIAVNYVCFLMRQLKLQEPAVHL